MSHYSPANAANTHDSNGRPLNVQRLGAGAAGSQTQLLHPAQPHQNGMQQQQHRRQNDGQNVTHNGENVDQARAAYGGTQKNVGDGFQSRFRGGNMAAEVQQQAAAIARPKDAAQPEAHVVHNGHNKGKAKATYGAEQINFD